MIPFVDLVAQYRELQADIDAAIHRVLLSGHFVLGDAVAQFEDVFAAYIGSRYCVAVNSGTSALHLAMLAAGIGPGDEVITVPLTFVATVAAISYTGATPVLVDVDPDTLTLDVEAAARAVTARSRAIIPVHLYGQPAAMDDLLELAHRHDLVVIEDAAQAAGGRFRERALGSIGQLGCFSFYPTKNLGAMGEGGAVVTDDEELYARLRALRNWGESAGTNPIVKGHNCRLQALQAAILHTKLPHLDRWVARRQEYARLYTSVFRSAGVAVAGRPSEGGHACHIYAIRSKKRDSIMEALSTRGVETRIHYPAPVHSLPAYADLGYARGQFPHAEAAASQVLSLPIYPELSPHDVERIAQAVIAVS
jgi:dTDP-4-amino-4,6-dideoxygalactose transaminase